MNLTESEADVDLRPYIVSLLHHWWQIALVAILVALLGFIYSRTRPERYESTATLLITRSRPSLALAEQFPTISEPIDARSRMDAILSIARSDAVAVETLELLGDSLPPQLRSKEALSRMVNVESKGDAVLVISSAGNPRLAAEIAGTWARRIAADVNQAYSGSQPLEEITAQVGISREEYESAQQELEDFLQTNQSTALEKQINEATALVDEIAKARALQYASEFERKQTLDQLLMQAEALKEQIRGGNRSAAGDFGDALAILNARAGALGLLSSLTFDISLNEVDALRDTPANYIADLDSLIERLRAEIALMDQALVQLAAGEMDESAADELETTAAQIQELKSAYEREFSQERELTGQRDAAWNAYQALVQKEIELKNLPNTANQVSMVGRAVANERPISQNTFRNTLVAGVLGLLLTVFVVLGITWWRSGSS